MDYTYSKVAVYAELGGALRLARNSRTFVTDPVTAAPINVTQGAFTAPYLDTDAHGIADFTATTPGPIRLTTGATFVDVFSEELPGLALAAVTSSAASAVAASASAAAAAASAALVGAPADVAMAAIVGNPASATSVSLGSTYGTLAQVATKVTTSNRPISLRGQAGIDFTGVTDSSAAVQAIITAAPHGSLIDLGVGGKIRLDAGLDLSAKNYVTLAGTTLVIGTGVNNAPVLLDFSHMTTGTAITLGVSSTLRDLYVGGPGYGVAGVTGIASAANVARLHNVQVYGFATGVSLTQVWYGILAACEIGLCATALYVNYCYNLRLDDLKINGTNGAGWGTGITMVSTCMVNLRGGSIENTQTGIQMSASSSLNMEGTYWETAAPNAIGVNMNGFIYALLNAKGCQVYVNNYAGWLDTRGSVGSTVNAGGNFFKASGVSGTPNPPVAYLFDAAPNYDITIGAAERDSWKNAIATYPAALYTNHDGLLVDKLTVCAPSVYTLNARDAASENHGRDIRLSYGKSIVVGATSTGGRTSAVTAGNGAMGYDFTLHKPIWSDGTVWRDATGTAV